MKAREVDNAKLSYQPYEGCCCSDSELHARAGQEITLLPGSLPRVYTRDMRSVRFPDGEVVEVFLDEIIINK